jgi:hypothetical protein
VIAGHFDALLLCDARERGSSVRVLLALVDQLIASASSPAPATAGS